MDYDMRLVWFAYFCIVVVLLEIITACTEALFTYGRGRQVRLWIRPARLSLVWTGFVFGLFFGKPLFGTAMAWDLAMNGPYVVVVRAD